MSFGVGRLVPEYFCAVLGEPVSHARLTACGIGWMTGMNRPLPGPPPLAVLAREGESCGNARAGCDVGRRNENPLLREAGEGQGGGAFYLTSTVANPNSSPMLTTSVAVVRKMLEAVAGSKPRRFSVSGTRAPDNPLMTQLPIIASTTTNPSM